ncbi:putative immunity protein [Devosia sp. 2618]|uniref:putative immunity protein n=1 Tax=Devosia sp. 2618 TaxID=3156454 RepID=UPI0033909467
MHHNSDDHRALALWAATCAERVLPLFESDVPGDQRPRQAIGAVRRWAKGNLSVAHARQYALDAHAAAREAPNGAAREAARAAGHAAATAHVPSHAPHAANYALKAVEAAGGNVDAEEAWQDDNLPKLG